MNPENYGRKRSTLHLPIWTSVVLLSISLILLVIWIVLWAIDELSGALTIGIIAFALSLVGISFYLFLTIKEIRLNRRQANFVDSVTHELKTPISALRLYLETLQMRKLDDKQRGEFYEVMENELQRLDGLINQLLEVGRLDAVGHDSDPEDIDLGTMLRRRGVAVCAHHKVDAENVLTFDLEPAVVNARRMPVEMVFGNLLDNAVKYSGEDPHVHVEVRVKDRGRVVTRIIDNGEGVPAESRNKIFGLFYRGGDELHRTKKGTGVGLYIVRTLVHILKGTVHVHNRPNEPGSIFEVELPGRFEPSLLKQTQSSEVNPTLREPVTTDS